MKIMMCPERLCIFMLFIPYFVLAADELYDILGVPRRASSQDIKRAYKALAREWHPDKNKDPTATDKFTKINEAYETLSDPERRANYDNYGYTSAQEQRPRHTGPGHGFHPFDDFFGGGFGPFGFHGRESVSMEKFQITMRQYESKLHPGSHQNPCFIYVFSDFCFNCLRIEPVVFKFLTELDAVGICVGAVHLRRSPGLASHMRLHSAPSLLGVISGRITYYKSSGISYQLLRDFVKELFPVGTLTPVNDNSFDSFLDGWKDNRVRAIFFSPKRDPSLRFLGPAFSFRDRIAFGYVHTESGESGRIMKQYNINKHRETLLLWNEIPGQTLAAIAMQQLSRSTIDEVLFNNRYLVLPRLSSQAVFEELCPQEPRLKRRKLCVALVTKRLNEHDKARMSFREFAQSSRFSNDQVRFAYLYEDVQLNFVKALTKGNVTSRSHMVLEVAILWKTDSHRLSYDFFEDGWNLDPDTAPLSREKLEQRLTQLLSGEHLLPYRATVPEFYNEHMLGLLTRIMYKLVDWYDRIYYYCTSYDGMTLLTALATVIIIGAMALSMRRLACEEAEQMKKDKLAKKSQKRPPSCSPDNQTIHLYELRSETFQNLVSEADTGLTIALLLDEHSKVKLMRKFAEIMQPFSRYSALTFAFLQLEYYLDWYRHLLELSLDFKVTLDSINNRNCIGSVLAINGYRKYYYIYHPKRARRWMRRHHGSNITKAVGFGDSDSESSDEGGVSREENVLFEDELLAGLAMWMDRVFDGSVKKVRLSYWPEISK